MWLINRRKGSIIIGILAGIGLTVFYAGLIGLTSRSWNHVTELFAADWPYVVVISLGFGVQMGLFVHLRWVIRQSGAGGTMVAAAGTGTSSATMVACCLHHLADVAPLIGLSGAAVFLSQYKYPVMSLGIVANAVGIAIMVRTIRRHGESAPCAVATDSPAEPQTEKG